MKLSAVTISDKPVKWSLEIPHITYTGGYKPIFLIGESKSIERVEYLAKRRNAAVQELLNCFPSTTHILMIDSHYCNQLDEIYRLVADHYDSDWDTTILGGSTWFHSQMWPHKRIIFWDSWTTPEGLSHHINDGQWKDRAHHGGYLKVKAVGGAMIFPRKAWESTKFDTSQWPNGSECNGFCINSGLNVYLDFYSKFFHPDPPQHSLPKTLKLKTYKPLRVKVGKLLRK